MTERSKARKIGNVRTNNYHEGISPCRCGIPGILCSGNLFRMEPGPDLLGKVFSNLVRMHEIRVDVRRDTRILVNKTCVKFYLKNFYAFIISHTAQNPGLYGLSFQERHHSFTRALNV
jgi:hypothetical protein